jgi:hypothetical protein
MDSPVIVVVAANNLHFERLKMQHEVNTMLCIGALYLMSQIYYTANATISQLTLKKLRNGN